MKKANTINTNCDILEPKTVQDLQREHLTSLAAEPKPKMLQRQYFLLDSLEQLGTLLKTRKRNYSLAILPYMNAINNKEYTSNILDSMTAFGLAVAHLVRNGADIVVIMQPDTEIDMRSRIANETIHEAMVELTNTSMPIVYHKVDLTKKKKNITLALSDKHYKSPFNRFKTMKLWL